MSGPGRISIIAAVAENGVIGRDGDLPWRLSADLKRFKRLTMERPIVMGRRTWESIGRALPGRTSIVVTRQREYEPNAPGVLVAVSLDTAIAAARRVNGGESEIFVIGGGEIYAAALPIADRLYLTRVADDTPGDVRFPSLDLERWQLVSREEHAADADNQYPFAFESYEAVDG